MSLYGKNQPDNHILGVNSWNILNKIDTSFGYSTNEKPIGKPSSSESKDLWFPLNTKYKVLIVGNSHSKDLFNALELNKTLFADAAFARYGIQVSASNEELDKLKKSPNYRAANIIIVSSRYGKSMEALPQFINSLKAPGKTLVLASNTVEFNSYGGVENIFDRYFSDNLNSFNNEELNKLYYTKINEHKLKINRQVKTIADQANVTYLDKYPIICDDINQVCYGITEEGYKSFYDYGHYTLEGADYFGKRIALLDWLAPAFNRLNESEFNE
jgi:hypothetical protein